MTENDVKLIIVGSDAEYSQAMDIRRQVFVNEQKISENREFDGNDHSSSHVLALCDNQPIGTMRIRYFNGFVKFERMCVLRAFRKTDVSEQIMQKGMEFAATKGYEKIYGICKKELLPRWQKDGFEAIKDVTIVEQNGMMLIPVWCPLPKVDTILTMQTPAEVLNAKEGDWHKVEVKEVAPKNNQFNEQIKDMLTQVRLLKNKEEPVQQKPPFKTVSPLHSFEH